MISSIETSDFSEFFESIYNYPPFPWQKRLAKIVCETGKFPAVLDLPTGTGKTSCIDISLFHLAYDLARGDMRKAPLRIAWVVDRRLIVDDVYDRANVIAEKLGSATQGVLKTIGDAFRTVAGPGAPPLVVKRLRGGIPREGDWARTPTQPTVVSSTVDQIGSRLLFRGYGIQDKMLSIQAGLLGEDALIILDEVHLSEPFRQTLDRVSTYPRSNGPWCYVQLSATPRSQGTDVAFTLDERDYANAVLAKRLGAPKNAVLVRLGRIAYGSDEHAERFAREAMARARLDDPRGPKTTLIVVNRVELARRIHEKLADLLKKANHEATITRLVGRGRDLEKDIISKQVVSRCKSDPLQKNVERDETPFFVVATQTVEAGADLDFDGLITQIAPIDALRQRFGRLNRMGRPIEASAAILATESEIAASAKPDPIYELASRNTWTWLEERSTGTPASFNFAANALELNPDDLRELGSPAPDAPLLMPEHVKTFSRTSPIPPWSPDASLYLHGSPDSPADVNIVWRADLPEAETEAQQVTNILALLPPRMGEVVSMPVSAVRRWLKGDHVPDISDLEVNSADTALEKLVGKTHTAWRWLGADRDAEFVVWGNVRPGDTIVVSTRIGGCDRFGWNPMEPRVSDIADAAAAPYQRRTFAVRLHPRVLEQIIWNDSTSESDEELREESASLWNSVKRELAAWEKPKALLDALIGNDSQTGLPLPDSLREALESLRKQKMTIEFPYDRDNNEERGARGVVLFARRGLKGEKLLGQQEQFESVTEGDGVGSLGTGEPLSLVEHSNDVRAWAAAFADRLKFPKALAEDLALAGYLHDLGKADSRFQRYLAGNPWGTSIVLAKSGLRRSARENANALRAAGLPENWRHEALSVRIAREHPSFGSAHDPELVLWLIGTHHGYGRPRFPHAEPRDDDSASFFGFEPFVENGIVVPPSSGPQRIDFAFDVTSTHGLISVDWPMMFERLEERYGIWGLARLESIVRLADHRASEFAERQRATVRV